MYSCLPPLDEVRDLVTELVEGRVGDVPGPGQVVVDLLFDAGGLVGQHQDALAEVDGLLDVVGDEDDCGTGALPELDELVLQLVAQGVVQLAIGLVHQQQLGLDGEGPGDAHPLEHTGRELAGVVAPVLGEAHQLEHLLHPLFDLLRGALFDLEAVGDVLLHRGPGEGGVLLEDVGDVVLLEVHGLAVDEDFAAGELIGLELGQAV